MTTDEYSPSPATEHRLQSFYADLAAVDLHPLWNLTGELLTPVPQPRAIPWLWASATYRPLAQRAIDLVPVERGGERRVLSLGNPGLGGRPYAAGTLWGAVQCLGPYESAPAHRHTPGAIRFVLEGEGVWTTVDGDACDMRPGDLILTPGWQWHDHTNGGESMMLWFDGLDLPMIEALDAVFFEPYPERQQPVAGRHDESAAQDTGGTGEFASARVTEALDPEPSPLLIYRWTDTDAELERLAAARKEAMVSVEFTNPHSGASALPTLSCAMHRLAPGCSTLPQRQTGNVVYVVYTGRGHSVIAGQRFDWTAGDMFVVPSWTPVEHHTGEQADLFTLSDSPVLRALGIYQEQTLSEPQGRTSTFQPR